MITATEFDSGEIGAIAQLNLRFTPISEKGISTCQSQLQYYAKRS